MKYSILLLLLFVSGLPAESLYVMQPLHGNRAPLVDAVIAAPSLAGVHVRDKWSLLEPARGRYDFAFIDQQLARAARLGKQVTLGIYAGAANDPPWNDVDSFAALVAVCGRRYAGHPALAAVHLSAPQVTNESMEMYLPPNWRGSDAAAVAIWQRCIDAFAEAFPNTPLILNLAMAPNSRGAITRAVDEYARQRLGPRFVVIVCNLKASTNVTAPHIRELTRLHGEGVMIGFEMVCPSSDRQRFGGSFGQAMMLGRRLGGELFQIYQADVPRE